MKQLVFLLLLLLAVACGSKQPAGYAEMKVTCESEVIGYKNDLHPNGLIADFRSKELIAKALKLYGSKGYTVADIHPLIETAYEKGKILRVRFYSDDKQFSVRFLDKMTECYGELMNDRATQLAKRELVRVRRDLDSIGTVIGELNSELEQLRKQYPYVDPDWPSNGIRFEGIFDEAMIGKYHTKGEELLRAKREEDRLKQLENQLDLPRFTTPSDLVIVLPSKYVSNK